MGTFLAENSSKIIIIVVFLKSSEENIKKAWMLAWMTERIEILKEWKSE